MRNCQANAGRFLIAEYSFFIEWQGMFFSLYWAFMYSTVSVSSQCKVRVNCCTKYNTMSLNSDFGGFLILLAQRRYIRNQVSSIKLWSLHTSYCSFKCKYFVRLKVFVLLCTSCKTGRKAKIDQWNGFEFICRKTGAKFLVPDSGIKSTLAQSRRTGLPVYIGWRAGTNNPMPESTISPSQGPSIWPLYAGLAKGVKERLQRW